jgi:hypothetical protein
MQLDASEIIADKMRGRIDQNKTFTDGTIENEDKY